MSKKKPVKVHEERVRITFVTFGQPVSKKKAASIKKSKRTIVTKDGTTTIGVNRKGVRYVRRERFYKSSQAGKKLVRLSQEVKKTMKKGDRVSLTTQFYSGKMKRTTGKKLGKKTQLGSVLRFTEVKARKNRKTGKKYLKEQSPKWTKKQIDRRVHYMLDQMATFVAMYDIANDIPLPEGAGVLMNGYEGEEE
jgi:hypothetical protein